MIFDDLPLYEAVYNVYQLADNPRSDSWLLPPKCERLCRMLQGELPIGAPFTMEQMLQVWGTFGRALTVEGEMKKSELIVLVARTHGRRCFYCGRGKGECSNEVTLDRIVPGSRGGKYTVENCMLACSAHNTQRGNQPLEQFLAPVAEDRA